MLQHHDYTKFFFIKLVKRFTILVTWMQFLPNDSKGQNSDSDSIYIYSSAIAAASNLEKLTEHNPSQPQN